jgi:hypothetical protein
VQVLRWFDVVTVVAQALVEFVNALFACLGEADVEAGGVFDGLTTLDQG